MLVVNQLLSESGQFFSSKLQKLDLEPIEKQLMQLGWTHQQTTLAINRYKMFLSVAYLHPYTPLVPTQEIDFVWHNHILHTRKYRQDCQMLFGRFIDHEPSREPWEITEQISLDSAFIQTQELLFQQFGDAVMPDTNLDQLNGISPTKNLSQQKSSKKRHLHLVHSACGRPSINLLKTSYLCRDCS